FPLRVLPQPWGTASPRRRRRPESPRRSSSRSSAPRLRPPRAQSPTVTRLQRRRPPRRQRRHHSPCRRGNQLLPRPLQAQQAGTPCASRLPQEWCRSTTTRRCRPPRSPSPLRSAAGASALSSMGASLTPGGCGARGGGEADGGGPHHQRHRQLHYGGGGDGARAPPQHTATGGLRALGAALQPVGGGARRTGALGDDAMGHQGRAEGRAAASTEATPSPTHHMDPCSFFRPALLLLPTSLAPYSLAAMAMGVHGFFSKCVLLGKCAACSAPFSALPSAAPSSHARVSRGHRCCGDEATAARGEVSFTWKQRVAVALGCAEALTTIHANNFVHRDFKATNVLLRQVSGRGRATREVGRKGRWDGEGGGTGREVQGEGRWEGKGGGRGREVGGEGRWEGREVGGEGRWEGKGGGRGREGAEAR
ncbi:unnamed protein product, partial [Closterium sp. Yama58-4]